jgi:hypothetical protein
MHYPGWIEREAPLARCPRKVCRRSGLCARETGKRPCARTHETRDAFNWALARKLAEINEENLRKNPELRNKVHDPYEVELKMKYLKEMLHARDEADMQERLAAQRQKQKQKRA